MYKVKNDVKVLFLLFSMSIGLSASGYELELDKWNTNLPPVDFHGFASQGFLYSGGYNYLGQSKDGSLKFTEMGINAEFNPFPRTRIAIQGFDYSIGNVGQYNALLDYALVEYNAYDWLGVRGGRIRRPGGIYNHIQDVDLARTSVLLPQGVYDSRWRDFTGAIDGGEFFGNINLHKAGSLSYEAFAGFLNMDDNGGVARKIQNNVYLTNLAGPSYLHSAYAGIDQSIMSGAQVWWNTPAEGLRAGILGGFVKGFGYHVSTTGNAPTGLMPPFPATIPVNVDSHYYADIPFFHTSLEYLRHDWIFQAEYYTYRLQPMLASTGAAPMLQEPSEPDSWYVSVGYKFNEWLQSSAYYSEYYANDHSRGSSRNYQKDTALSFRFDIKDWWILKVEGHYIHGTALLYDDEHNPVQNNNGWFMIAAKTTFSF